MNRTSWVVICGLLPTAVFSEQQLALPDRAIPMTCRLVNVVQNTGSQTNPEDQYWTLVEFEGRAKIGDQLDFSASQPFPLNPQYEWIDVTGVAEIKTGESVQQIVNKVRVFRDTSSNEYFVGLPEFNQIWITVNRLGLGIKHPDQPSYNASLMYEALGCYLVP